MSDDPAETEMVAVPNDVHHRLRGSGHDAP